MFNNSLLPESMSLGYALYSSVKGSSGDYVDFLLNYDAQDAQENGNGDWLSTMIKNEGLTLSSSAQTALSEAGIGLGDSSILDAISSSTQNGLLDNANLESQLGAQDSSFGSIDSLASAYKTQLISAFEQRYENESTNAQTKAAKIAALYQLADSISVPSRLA